MSPLSRSTLDTLDKLHASAAAFRRCALRPSPLALRPSRLLPRLLLFLLMLPAVAEAQLTYTTNGNALTITGYNGPVVGGSVAIPGAITGLPVTSIGMWAFFDCTSLTTVTIPNGVTNLGQYAFSGCTSLTRVTMGSGVTNIGEYAFDYCTSLKGLYFQGNAPGVGSPVFEADANAIVYYLPGTTGWGPTLGGRPTMLWENALPAITLQPQSQTVTPGENSTFTVAANGAPPLGYQWLFDGATIPGATTNSYKINDAQPADAGGYSVIVSNSAGSVTSAVAVLTVQVPHAATATATVVHDFVVGAAVTDEGFGYTNTPAVRIIGGGGSGAVAVAVVSNEVVVAVNILDAGEGYTNAPAIVIAPPFIAQPTIRIAARSLLSFTNLAVGTNYQLQSFLAGAWINIGPAFTAAGSTFTQYVPGTASSNGYCLAATPVPSQAYATAQVVNGFVVGATVTSGGSGYGSNVLVTILSEGSGSNAAAIATVSGGTVTGITITSAGIGYINTPAIIIAPPPANALWPTVTQVMELDFGSLSPYDNYQLEFTPVAGGAWSNLGIPFTPTSAASTQYVNASGSAGFFRVEYAP